MPPRTVAEELKLVQNAIQRLKDRFFSPQILHANHVKECRDCQLKEPCAEGDRLETDAAYAAENTATGDKVATRTTLLIPWLNGTTAVAEILDTHLAERPDDAEQLRLETERLEISAYRECGDQCEICLLYTSPSPRDKRQSRMPSSA